MSPVPRTVIGVDLGGTNVRAGRVTTGLEAHAFVTLRNTASQEAVLADLCASIEQVMAPGVEAIGLGVPSLVDAAQGIVYTATNIPSWQKVPLKQILEKRYRLPVHINNDANCFALGEFHFGQGQASQHMVGLIIGTGLGAGLIVRGRLYSGAHCGAGEIGNLPFRGETLEHYISGPRFERLHGQTGQTLLARANQGDEDARAAFADFGGHLGCAVKTILYAYDPDTIILGGSVSMAFPFFEVALRRSLADYAFPHILPNLRILASQDPHMPILGAAALCLDRTC